MHKVSTRNILLIFVLASVFLTGCLGGHNGSNGGGEGTYGIVKGNIYDKETGELITDRVRATLLTVLVLFPTDGEYRFERVPPGQRAVMIEAVGYHPATEEFRIAARETKTVDIYLEPKEEIPPPAIDFELVQVPGAPSFPIGVEDEGSCSEINYPYYLGKYQVTYGLWKQVYDWATKEERGFGQYFFKEPGRMGGGDLEVVKTEQHPVTLITWRDAMIWCNALTEYYNAANGTNLECVYTYRGGPVRDARNPNAAACDNVTAGPGDGFRLPLSMEWELAARYIGPWPPTETPLAAQAILMGGIYWTPGSYASGAWADWTNDAAVAEVAWHYYNSSYHTHEVGELAGNALGIHDMSGNIWEFCFDLQDDGNPSHVGRVFRGGGYNNPQFNQWIGFVSYLGPSRRAADTGFRIARSR